MEASEESHHLPTIAHFPYNGGACEDDDALAWSHFAVKGCLDAFKGHVRMALELQMNRFNFVLTHLTLVHRFNSLGDNVVRRWHGIKWYVARKMAQLLMIMMLVFMLDNAEPLRQECVGRENCA